ncbi:hypothetical protein RHMOL_Rhmol08G0327500 [Rhododendron molle]|uniref:Uncharacterized protein n=1 Tax=Rhododendron molle TaxID=49168 RepID=A0ACC0MVC7_RHOML|nr:hypothetical protein RHMOL_Rhmol08G0327500 [Rhododendron molle]
MHSSSSYRTHILCMVEVATFLDLTVIWPFSTMGAAIGKGAKGIGTLLGNAFVAPIKSVFGGSCDFAGFLSHVPGGNLPMHCEKPLQDVLGCVSDILVFIGIYHLFCLAQVKEHQTGKPSA